MKLTELKNLISDWSSRKLSPSVLSEGLVEIELPGDEYDALKEEIKIADHGMVSVSRGRTHITINNLNILILAAGLRRRRIKFIFDL